MDEVIRKGPPELTPTLPDYARACADFSWDTARAELAGLPGGGLNIAFEAVDRYATSAPERVAFRFLRRGGEVEDLTWAGLREGTARFAGVLEGLGVRPGDRVFALAGRIPELYVAALGTLRHGAVFCSLFAAFGPEPIRTRMEIGAGRVLVTTPALYTRKVAPIRDRLPALEFVLLTGDPNACPEGTLSLTRLLEEATPTKEAAQTREDDPALLHFTSGTTGKPKGALHAHGAVIWHRLSARWALDLHPEDVYWCTADPGWVTGVSYGIVGPLTNGVTSIVDEGEFNPERWYRILDEQRVTVWYTAPTALRLLIRAGMDLPRAVDLSRLRHVASVGEPLNPHAVRWGVEALGLPIHDTWWQTETGGILIANLAAEDIHPGAMGRTLPGIEAAILARRGDALEPAPPGEEGELAIRAGWPSMFRAYLNEEARYRRCFKDSWYLTGDLARRDADGLLWFVGRADDVINSSGHLVGPFEVESALMEHPGAAEAGVIGKPDPVAMEVVKAFVIPAAGRAPDEALRAELMAYARKRLGPAVAPREIEFVTTLPRTRSGKVLRRLLKARELGLPEGDTSTLEEAS
ncbi:MAG: acetate--CoA ligase [Planctomycetes bacterium]|nr:acetate--CoA ligase [Planctomycetota bacterium]